MSAYTRAGCFQAQLVITIPVRYAASMKHYGFRFCLAVLCLSASLIGAVRASPGEIGFLVIGDWGTGSDDQRRLARQMALASREIAARFVISTGDNFYPGGLKSGADPQLQSSFEEVYSDPALMIPWYLVFGNHDYRGDLKAEIDQSTANPRWRLPSAYYKHSEMLADGGWGDFFFIDTEAIGRRHKSWIPHLTRDPQLEWLERELASSKAAWKIVIGHHPVYSGGVHGGSKALVERLRPLLAKYGVQAYLNGHDHHLEHVVMGGTHYLTSGAGAMARPAAAGEGSQFVLGNRLGFMTARLDPAVMQIEFRGENGEILHRARIERGAHPSGGSPAMR